MEVYVTKALRITTEVNGPKVGSFVVQHFKTNWGRSTWAPTLAKALTSMLLRHMWVDAAAPAEATLDDVDKAIDKQRPFLVKLATRLVEQTSEIEAVQNTALLKGAFDDLDDL